MVSVCFFSVWLTSLSMIISRSIHVAANGIISFFFFFYNQMVFCCMYILMLKLKLQYLGHLIRRVDSLEKTLMLGGIGGRRKGDNWGWDGWMASLTQWTWVWVNSGSWRRTGRPGVLWFMGSQRVGHDWATELNRSHLFLSNHMSMNI